MASKGPVGHLDVVEVPSFLELARRGFPKDSPTCIRVAVNELGEALRAACANDHVDSVQLLIPHCDIPALARALVSAVAWGSCGAAKCIIASDPFRQLVNDNALLVAVAGAHLELVVLLLESGVRADRRILNAAVTSCAFGDTAWDVRARGPEARRVLCLIAENLFASRTLPTGPEWLASFTTVTCNILHGFVCGAAHRFHSLATVRLLMHFLTDCPSVCQPMGLSDAVNGIGCQTDDGQQLLMKAVSAYTHTRSGCRKKIHNQRPHAETVHIVEYLLECRADVCATTRCGWTALMYALRSDNEDVVYRLLQAKACATVNARNTRRDTALTFAVQWCRSTRVMGALFAAGASAGRRRALSIAAARYDDGFVTLLMAAWPTLDWIHGRRASAPCPLFSMTKLSDHPPSRMRHAKGMKAFACRVAHCRRTVLALLSAKANVNDCYDVYGSRHITNEASHKSNDGEHGEHGEHDEEGEEGDGGVSATTLLHEAAKARRACLVKVLIELGANVNARASCGWTPLDAACFHNAGSNTSSSHQILAIMWTRAHDAVRRRAVTQAASRGRVWRMARRFSAQFG